MRKWLVAVGFVFVVVALITGYGTTAFGQTGGTAPDPVPEATLDEILFQVQQLQADTLHARVASENLATHINDWPTEPEWDALVESWASVRSDADINNTNIEFMIQWVAANQELLTRLENWAELPEEGPVENKVSVQSPVGRVGTDVIVHTAARSCPSGSTHHEIRTVPSIQYVWTYWVETINGVVAVGRPLGNLPGGPGTEYSVRLDLLCS